MSQQVLEEHPYTKIKDDYEVTDVYQWLNDVIPYISFIGDYKGYTDENRLESDTPFDQFDSACHKVGTGIATQDSKKEIDEEEELIFLINLSEHVKRPLDMLMFLGEYFKQTVSETKYVHANTIESTESNKGKKKQDSFFLTSDIMNYLGTACKMYIEDLRQELRISIALWRNPTFHDGKGGQREQLEKNIQDLQILIVKRCAQVYKMIDYLHDTRMEVPLKYITSQPPPYILNALFCKMKADYLRYIYECLSGDNGLLANYNDDACKVNLMKIVELRDKDGVRAGNDDVDIVESEIYYTIYSSSTSKHTIKTAKAKMDNFYKDPMLLTDFLEHEVVFEYEKAKDQLFDNTHRPRKFQNRDNINEDEQALFHPVFLSSLLNQTVFMGDVQEQKYKDYLKKNFKIHQKKEELDKKRKEFQQLAQSQISDAGDTQENQELINKNTEDLDELLKEEQKRKSDTQIYHTKQENKKKLYEYVLRWTDEIDNFSYIMSMPNKEDQETARSIQNLLERAMENWNK